MKTIPLLISAIPTYMKLRASQFREPENLQKHQELRLQETLKSALQIPFYSKHLHNTTSEFQKLPVLKRKEINILNQSVRSLYSQERNYQSRRSSGSTGMPVEFLFDSSHQRGRYAARARYLRQNGWNPFHRLAWIIYIPHGTPDGSLIQKSERMGMKFLSLFTDFEQQCTWLQRLKPHYLYTYPSNLEALLDVFKKQNTTLPTLKRIFSGGEVLEDSIRQKTREILNVEISENYGTTEAFLAWECLKGSYHINAEHVFLEVVDDSSRPVSPGEVGRVLVTTLENHLMPLVRYEVGDYAVASKEQCPCGRTLPVLKRVVGRSINLFRLKDGQLISPWRLTVKFITFHKLKQFQIIQKDYERYLLRFAADSPLTPGELLSLRQAFQDTLGSQVTVEFDQVLNIPRTPSGKFMTALSLLPETPPESTNGQNEQMLP